jgi:hypothetical protein
MPLMTDIAAQAAPPDSPHPRLRIGLMVLSAFVLLGALGDVPLILWDYGHDTALLKFAQALTSVNTALAPLISAAALWFAFKGRLHHAIVALAVLMLAAWASDLPSIAIHGLELSGGLSSIAAVFLTRFVYPLLAVAAIVLAVKDRRLTLAGLLVALPTVITGLSVIAFAIGVARHGF